ncbi:aggregation-promoting factor C-terminal-like domain-containing protein [Rhizomonospora bruguierae]|uniref:aggregation-promoting factor C-terminal-like domain-containing protein n=1 Tax=Rhizomonospora bruguierae TaxID=1581705 RepID=UPI001BCD5B0B|nr:lytic transglycosylase domain-containing protein [Micromonospora sp. NBRC 107566]
MSSRRTSRSTWTRLGLRALAVGLLLTGVAGGVYVGQNRQDRQVQAARAAAAEAADQELLATLEEQRRESSERSARAEAERKAAVAAQNAAEQGRRAEKAVEQKTESTTGGPKPYTGPIPASCNEFSGVRKTGCALMIDAGFPISEFPCLNKLWTKESGWNYKAANAGSGAYGIPQAVPGSKMASVADDWKTNPATQIKWGLGYIKGRYGTPCKAWAQSESEGWY